MRLTEPNAFSAGKSDFNANEWPHKPFLNTPARLAALTAAAVIFRVALYLWLARGYGGINGTYCHFDCGFYLRIAATGYGTDTAYHGFGSYPNWAYFPLLPALLRAAAFITGWRLVVCGMVISAFALWLLGFVSALYIQYSRAAPETILWLLVLFTAPYGFFFSLPYTEVIFASLAASTLLARAAGRPMLAACCASLTAASRPTGMLLSMLIIADQFCVLWRRRHEKPRLAVCADVLPPMAIAPLGLTLFMAWQYYRIGDALAFGHVQIDWSRLWLGPITWIRLGLRTDDWPLVAALFPAQSASFNAAMAVLGLAASGWLALRRRFAEAWICAGAILLPLSSGIHSMPRFVGANPAFLFAVYDAMHWLRLRSKVLAVSVILLMAALQFLLLLTWYRFARGLY